MPEPRNNAEDDSMVESSVPIASPDSPIPTLGAIHASDRRASVGSQECSGSLNKLLPDDGVKELQEPLMGDPQRLALAQQLLDNHHDRVYRYAFHLLGCSASAEDIAQEVFVRAYSNAHQLRSLEAAGSWLLAITRNEVARWCNKWHAKQPIDCEPEVPNLHEGNLEDYEWVHQALQQLPMEFREVVLMFYFEQRSYAEIASELELPIGTVMSRLSRARNHLKKSLVSLAEPNSARASQQSTNENKEASR